MGISGPKQTKTKGPLRRALRRVLAAMTHVVLASVITSSAAPAAPITIPPQTLTAMTVTGPTGAPTVYIWDHFDRANGGIGSAVVGGVWSQNSGTWTIAGNLARSTSKVSANATIAVPLMVNARVDADLTFGPTAHAGVVLNGDGLNNMLVLYRKQGVVSQVRLHAWIGNVPLPAPVASTDVASASAAALSVVAVGSSVQVSWNGSVVISYTLTAAEQAALKDAGSNQFGLWAESDSTARFDNFRVQSP